MAFALFNVAGAGMQRPHDRRRPHRRAWMWLRLGRTAWWLIPGVVSLIGFAVALTRARLRFQARSTLSCAASFLHPDDVFGHTTRRRLLLCRING